MLNKEMHELRKGLDNAGIEWHDDSEMRMGMFFERTKFTNKYGDNCSVIFVEGMSYGWNVGLLEVMPPLHPDPNFQDEVEGWLTAEEILAEWT